MIALDITGENKDLIRKLMESERHVDRLQAKLSGAGRQGASEWSEVGKNILGVAGALVGVGGVTGAIQKVVEETRKAIAEIRAMEAGAARQQRAALLTVQGFIANNPQLDDSAARSMIDFARGEGARLGGADGMQKVLGGLTALRSGTPGAGDAEQLAAMRLAVDQAKVYENTDMGSFATAVLKISQSRDIGIPQAANVLGMYGARAGGDIATLAGQIAPLSALPGVSGSGLTEIMGLHGFLTGQMGDTTGEGTTTNVSNLLARIATREVEIGGRKVGMESEGGVDRLLEITGRIRGGDFGDQKAALTELTRSLGRESASAVTALSHIMEHPDRLRETLKMMRDAETMEGSFAQEQFGRIGRIVGYQTAIEGTRLQAGRRGAAEERDIQGSAMAEAEDRLGEFDSEMGMTSAFDVGRLGRRWMAGNMTPAEFERAERLRRLRRGVRGRIGGDPYAEEYVDPLAGADSEGEILLRGLYGGGVNAAGGLDRLEQNMLRAGGADAETIERLQRMWLDGQKQAFREALGELLTALRTSPAATRQEVD